MPTAPTPPPLPLVGVLFDLDGTLVDSEALNWIAWDAVLGEVAGVGTRCASSSTQALITGPALRGASAPAIAAELISSRGIGAPHTVESLVSRKRALAVELATRGEVDLASLWFPGVVAAIRALQARLGAGGIGLCTSNLRPIAGAVLLAGRVDASFGGGRTVQEDVAPAEMKPHPAPYARALEQMGMMLRAEAVAAVEDSAAGVRSAVAAGVGVVLGVLNVGGDAAVAAAATAAVLRDAGAWWVFPTTVAAVEWILEHTVVAPASNM